jgi:glyoxylase-like metal-dependent hydrolase (beta-lactamase superfamily II)
MKVLMNTGGLAATNAYVIADEQAKQAVLFDAPNDTTGMLLDQVQSNGWELIGLWLTHGHFDHLADHMVVRQRFPSARVLIHKLDEPKLIKPGSAIFPLPFVIPPGRADAYLEDGQELHIGSVRVQVLFTPGHSTGHVAFHLPEQMVLVGGDLIIGGAVGRTDLPGCNPSHLEDSIRRVMRLPDDTTLLPGHGHPSKLREERQTNEYVRAILASSPRAGRI